MRYIFLLLLTLCLAACDEIPPTLNPQMGGGPDNPTLENQQRQVLIEEFTGVRCVNCPAGSQTIETLLNIHGEQLVAISIHAGIFSQPYSDSDYDFRTSSGTNIQGYVGAPLGYPTAVVDRRKFDAEESTQIGQSQWAGYIAQELQRAPRVKLAVDVSYDEVTRNIVASVTVLPQENIQEDDIRISLFVTETNIVDKQLTPTGENDAYVHKHVFRAAISPYDGRPITAPLLTDIGIEENFTTTLSPDWVAENCHLVAFVHLNGSVKDVLQAIEVPVQE